MVDQRRARAGATAGSFVLAGAVALATWRITGPAYASTATAALTLVVLATNWTVVADVVPAVANWLATPGTRSSPLRVGRRGVSSTPGGGSSDGRDPSAATGNGGDGDSWPAARHRPRSPGSSTDYSRHDGSDPLSNDVRRGVYESIERSPGTYQAKLAAGTDASLSTVRYHLRVLLEEELIEEAKFGGKRRLYPVGSDHLALAAALEDDARGSILRTLARSGPATVSGLADRLDRAPSTLSYHLSRLEEDGLVVRENEGVSVVTRLDPTVRAELGVSRAETADERVAASTQLRRSVSTAPNG